MHAIRSDRCASCLRSRSWRCPSVATRTRRWTRSTAAPMTTFANPSGPRSFVARVKNALRRRALQQGKSALLVSADLEIDLIHRRVRSRGCDVHLARKPYEVLRSPRRGRGQGDHARDHSAHGMGRAQPSSDRIPAGRHSGTSAEARTRSSPSPSHHHGTACRLSPGRRVRPEQPRLRHEASLVARPS